MTLSLRLKKSFPWLMTPAAALVLFLSIQGIAQIVGANLGLDPRSLAIDGAFARASLAHGAPPFHTTSAAALLAHNPFDSQARLIPPDPCDDPPSDGSDTKNAPPCEGVRVLGIVSSADPEWSLAEFLPLPENADPHAVLRRRGGDVGPLHVEFIAWDRVWMASPTGLCQASMFTSKTDPPRKVIVAQPVVSPGSPLEPWILKGIEVVSPTERNIDRGIIPRLIERQADLVKPARAVPEFVNGKVAGIRVTGVKPDSLLGVLGLVDGDRLQTINGYDLADPHSALEAYARLQQADRLLLQVNRGGRDVGLELNIR